MLETREATFNGLIKDLKEKFQSELEAVKKEVVRAEVQDLLKVHLHAVNLDVVQAPTLQLEDVQVQVNRSTKEMRLSAVTTN